MTKIRDFDMLRVGQHVKIEGKYLNNGTLLALEINVRPPARSNVIVGMVEKVDPINQQLTIMGKPFPVSQHIEIRNKARKQIHLEALAGKMVKLTGKFQGPGGFETWKIREEKTLDFNIDKMKGVIECIDPTAHTIEVNGFTVSLNFDTAIEEG